MKHLSDAKIFIEKGQKDVDIQRGKTYDGK